MAYVSKETKAELVAAVKKVLPAEWKVTFRVEHYSKIVCIIRKAPVDLVECYGNDDGECPSYYRINEYNIRNHCANKEVADVLVNIVDALNGKNHDNSDVMTDYFDVGYYIDVMFGDWKKPFESTK